MFRGPAGVVADTSSNLFVWDGGNRLVRKITPSGFVSTFAGGGTNALPGYGTNVMLPFMPYTSMAIDHSNTVWIANTWAGEPGFLLRVGNDGSVSSNYCSALSQSTRSSIAGICVDSQNNIYLSSGRSGQIYRYYPTNGAMLLFASFTNQGANLLTADASGNIYTYCAGNYTYTSSIICKIDQNQNVTVLWTGSSNSYLTADGVGTNAGFSDIPLAMCNDGSGNIIFACVLSIRKLNVATSEVTTIAGSFTSQGYVDGTNYLARFGWAEGVCMSQGRIFVADGNNQCIREIYLNPAGSNILSASICAVVSITGVVGRLYQIESSTDLNTWNPETTIILTSSPFLWIDQNGLGQKKFYRAVLLP